jgi:putative ABC transport system ATP-binding protein
MELLLKLNRESKTTLIIVTHDPEIAQLTRRMIHIRDGVVVDDQVNRRKLLDNLHS